MLSPSAFFFVRFYTYQPKNTEKKHLFVQRLSASCDQQVLLIIQQNNNVDNIYLFRL